MVTSLKLADVIAGALGLPPGTVVQHLRNLQKHDKITFKGHGRGAAHMSPMDAARLLIAVVGADFVKDSLRALDSFGALLPVAVGRPRPQVTFLDHLTGLMTGIASAAYGGGERELPKLTNVAFTLLSAACEDPERHPRFAVAKTGKSLMGAISFAPAGLDEPVLSEADFAMRLRGSGSGLVRVKIVTIEAVCAIAGSL